MIENADGTLRSVRVFKSVLGIADRGRDHLRAWETLDSWFEPDTWIADLAMPFFVLTGIAHVEAAVMHAAKLTDAHKDSVKVEYLFNIIEDENRQGLLLRTDGPKLVSAVAEGRCRLAQMSETVARIRDKRDGELAHLDKRSLNVAHRSQQIEVADLHTVFDAVDEIANTLLTASPSAFGDVPRFSIGFGTAPPEWTADLLYFARAGFYNESVQSPNARSERTRAWDRALRAARIMPDRSE